MYVCVCVNVCVHVRVCESVCVYMCVHILYPPTSPTYTSPIYFTHNWKNGKPFFSVVTTTFLVNLTILTSLL